MTSTGPTRWLASLGILLALALPVVLMACGGDEPDADGERTATPRTEATETGDAPTATVALRPTATTVPLVTIGRTSAATDREALVAFYNATGGPNWNDDENWLSDAPLGEWYGVITDDNGRVTTLGLGSNELSGEIPPELGSLSNLEVLVLYDNGLRGEIPAELGSLANLEELKLNHNQLRGEIPPELGSLANLEQLFLHENQLSGEIPPWLGSLANLVTLALGGNELSGEIPPELGRLANLTLLWLDDNELSGEIPPELGSLANLEHLSLHENQLSGEIPPWLGSLANLRWLGLGSNDLSGCVSSSLQGQLDMSSSYLGDLPFC